MKSVRSDTYRAVVRCLRDARKRAGLTQAELAERLGRPQSFVAKYEQGERRIDVAEFIEIAKALGANPVRVFSAIARELDA
jgi:transcriptional regulator with XRE-family HTH domain